MKIERLSSVEDKTQKLRDVNTNCKFKKPKFRIEIGTDGYGHSVEYDCPRQGLSNRRDHDGETND